MREKVFSWHSTVEFQEKLLLIAGIEFIVIKFNCSSSQLETVCDREKRWYQSAYPCQ